MSQIYIINGTERAPVDGIGAGNIRDAVDTDNTLALTLYNDDVARILSGSVIEYEGQFYDVVTCEKYMNGQAPFADITAENVIYRLSSRTVRASTSGPTSGSVAQLMTRVLSYGAFIFSDPQPNELSEFTFGATDISGTVNFYAPAAECSRREMMNKIASAAGGEIEVSGYTVNVWAHRGSVNPIELLDTDAVDEVIERVDFRTGRKSYDIKLLRRVNLGAGDEIHLKFTPLGIDVYTRIIAIEYTPNNEYEVSIDVGDYEPDIKDLLVSG